MRKVFLLFATLAIAVVASLTSCHKTEYFTPDGMCPRQIAVSPVAVRNTKAAIDGTVFPDERTIIMSAYFNAAEGDSGNYFDNIEFSKSGTTWSADKYWPLTGTLDFLGVSYNGLTVSNIAYSTKVCDTISFDVPDNSSIQTDILHSAVTGQSYASAGTPMTFKHAGAVLVFTAGSTVAYDATTNVGITINKITLKDAKHSGKLTISANEDSSNGYCVWSALDNKKDVDLPGLTTYNVPATPMDITATGNHMGIGSTGILVPEQAQTSFTVFYTMHNGKDKSSVALDTDMQYTYTCSGDWTEGKKYNYAINFNVNKIQVAPSITDWVTFDEGITIPEPVAATYGVSAQTSVSLPKGVLASDSEVLVNWNDGTMEAFTNVTKSTLNADTLTISHTYASAFTGNVEIAVRKGSIDFGEVESSEFEKFSVIDTSKIIIAEKQGLLLPGVFTVNSEGKKVKFSKGNLMANVNAEGTAVTEWKLAEHQYDYVGNTTAQQQCKGGWVDLFGWTAEGKYSDGVKQYGINSSINSSDYVKDGTTDACCDWGSLIDPNLTMLSESEWRYLIDNNLAIPTDSPYHFYTDNGGNLSSPWVNGFYTEEEAKDLYNSLEDKPYGTFENALNEGSICDNGNTYCFKVASGFGCILKHDGFSGTVNDSYTAEEWVAAEESGLVFIPLAGYRIGSDVGGVGSGGYCWSSTPLEGLEYRACRAYFYYVDAYVNRNSRYGANSVRLVSVQ